jgi:hypothetical protein
MPGREHVVGDRVGERLEDRGLDLVVVDGPPPGNVTDVPGLGAGSDEAAAGRVDPVGEDDQVGGHAAARGELQAAARVVEADALLGQVVSLAAVELQEPAIEEVIGREAVAALFLVRDPA